MGIAVVAHPHPKLGGTAEHKIPHILARVLQAHGFLTLRPYFRGAGGTEGEHDAGDGETADMLAVVNNLRRGHPGLPLALAGFSFGAFVQAMVAKRLLEEGQPIARMILAGTPVGTVDGQRTYRTPPVPSHSRIVHGERDESAPLRAVLDWARPQDLPVVVIPGANHFFTGKLQALQKIVTEYLDSRL